MGKRWNRNGLWALFAVMIGIATPLPLLAAEPPAPPPPKVVFVLKDRVAHAKPEKTGTTHTGGGAVDVAQPREDTLIFTMMGAVVAGPHPCKDSLAHMDFDLNQQLAIVFADPKVQKARLTIEAHVIGLLRGDEHEGSASVGHGQASLVLGHGSVVAVALEEHAVSGDDNRAINDHKGPVSVSVQAGDYHLLQTFRISAAHAQTICGKAASAEFAPDPALDKTWISFKDPFHGVNKKDFGFRVTLRVEPE